MSLQIYKLPNHSWLPASFNPLESNVVRREGNAVLVRSKTWERAKNPRFNYTPEWCGKENPNDTWKPFDLWKWGEPTIEILAQKATDGDSEAAQELARLAMAATQHLTKICKCNPKLFRPLSRLKRGWPVIKMKREKLSTAESDLFDAIELGADDFIENDRQTAKWRLDDAGRIALGLLNYVRKARASSPKKSSIWYGGFGALAKKHLKQDFSDASADAWWEFAKEILLFSYPRPQAVDEFINLISPRSPKARTPGRLKQAILDTLQARFKSFAQNLY